MQFVFGSLHSKSCISRTVRVRNSSAASDSAEAKRLIFSFSDFSTSQLSELLFGRILDKTDKTGLEKYKVPGL